MVSIIEVTDKAQLRRFVDYPNELYKDVPQFVPATYGDDLSDWDRSKNPAFEYCDARCWLAMRDGEIVGRIGAIHSRKANDKWGANRLRFTQVDFIDDPEVSSALFRTVEAWAKELDCAVHGPLGFTDMDREGMLVEGFARRSCFFTYYNYPYYIDHMAALGYVKDVDWIEELITVPEDEATIQRWEKISDFVLKRHRLHIHEARSRLSYLPLLKPFFELAQKLMAERANECNALRTMPRNTRGQSLLSGNVFCGHCGGRLTLTTNGTTRINAAGEKVGRKRIRYVCYNKTRKRSNCDGQTGYTMHILDKMVTDILHQVFDRMRSVEENEIISRTHRSAMVSLKKRLADAKAESAKAAKEYESLKLEIIKAVQGESAFPMEVLSELVNNARTRMLDANAQLTELNEEVEKSNQRIEAIKADYRRIMEWSEMFDGSDMDVKKMIAGYIIKRVDVYSDYRLHIELNMSFAQFELGLGSQEINPA